MRFGLLRYILAWLVLITHIAPLPMAFGAGQAVFAFYILSGFLMTLVLTEKYGFSGRGIRNFALCRALRIYPLYFIALLISFLILWVGGRANFHPAIVFPATVLDWVRNVTIFGLAPLASNEVPAVRLVPQAWALGVEVCFYCVIPFLVWSKWVTLIWFLLSLAVTAYVNVRFARSYFYHSLAAASLPFSAGAMIYHYLHRGRMRAFSLGRTVSVPLAVGLVLLYLVNLVVFRHVISAERRVGFYVSLALSVVVVACFSKMRLMERDTAADRIDKFCGDLSYPIFLLHWSAAIIGNGLFFGCVKPDRDSFTTAAMLFLLATAVVTHALGIAFVKLVEEPIQRVRACVRRL